WSSCTRVKCQISQAMELAPGSIRWASCSRVNPRTAPCTAWLTRSKASRKTSRLDIGLLPSIRVPWVTVSTVELGSRPMRSGSRTPRDAAEAAQPQAVGDHEDAGERHRRTGDHRVQQAEGGQR